MSSIRPKVKTGLFYISLTKTLSLTDKYFQIFQILQIKFLVADPSLIFWPNAKKALTLQNLFTFVWKFSNHRRGICKRQRTLITKKPTFDFYSDAAIYFQYIYSTKIVSKKILKILQIFSLMHFRQFLVDKETVNMSSEVGNQHVLLLKISKLANFYDVQLYGCIS